MGGNSGGVGSDIPADPTNPTPTPAGQAGGILGYNSIPAFMPGDDQMLAQQLAQGGYGGGNIQDILAHFQKIYSPVKVPTYDKATLPGITPLPEGESTRTPATKKPMTKTGSANTQRGTDR